MKKRRIDASVTVEASFVIPIIFFVILAIICLCLFMYDKARLQTDLILGLEYAHEGTDTNKAALSAEIAEYVTQRMQTGYISCVISKPRVQMNGKRMIINAGLTMTVPDKGFIGTMTGTYRRMEMSLETKIADREKILRMIAAGLDIWNEVK